MTPNYSKKWKNETTSTEVWFSKDPNQLPNFKLAPLSGNVFASYTGPDCGLDFVHKLESQENHSKGLEAGCAKWTVKNRKAYGISMSLYDQHPVNGKISGDPIADAFGLCARENGSIMIIADGVNWGEKSKIAARCAVYGAMKFINEQIFGVKVNLDSNKSSTCENNENETKNDVTEQQEINNPRMKTFENTKDIFDLLLKSLEEAHQMIIKHEGGLTTLCVCFVCPIQEPTPPPPHLLPASQSPLTSPSPKILASPESSSSPSPNSDDEKLLPDLIATSLSGLSSPSLSLPQIPSPSLSSPPPSLAANLPPKILTRTSSSPSPLPKRFMACVVNVGDSLAFVFSRRHGVREVTTGSHDVTCERDIRDAGGALGPVSNDGQPELNNLTCSMTCVEAGDVVFLATDGITDNFDPVVTKIAVAKKSSTIQSPSTVMMTKSTTDTNDITNVDDENDDDKTQNESTAPQSVEHNSSATQKVEENLLIPTNFANIQNSLIEEVEVVDPKLGLEDGKPIMLPYERHRYAIKEMERVLHEFELFTECPCSAQELCGALLQHVLKLTDAKRKVLENPDLYGKKKKLKPEEKQSRDLQITCKLAQSAGKLDHATIIGYEVGCFRGDEDEDYCYDA